MDCVLKLNELSNCRVDDRERILLINEILHPKHIPAYEMEPLEFYEPISCHEKCGVNLTKYCPECGCKFKDDENVCMDCLVHLKNLSEVIEVCEVKSYSQFVFKGENKYSTFDELLGDDNILKINQFSFNILDYQNIIHDIKSQVFRNFDAIVKSSEIDINNQFLQDSLDKPNYNALEIENCQILNDEGFIRSIWLMLYDGCRIACLNKDKLISINGGPA